MMEFSFQDKERLKFGDFESDLPAEEVERLRKILTETVPERVEFPWCVEESVTSDYSEAECSGLEFGFGVREILDKVLTDKQIKPPETIRPSWAGLFQGGSAPIEGHPTVSSDDTDLQFMGQMLLKASRTVEEPSKLRPRGLINRGNWCFLNAPLQALLSCPSFTRLLSYLPSSPPLRPSSTPALDCFGQLIAEFQPTSRQEQSPSEPFEPVIVHELLRKVQPSLIAQGHQQDAEEFLSLLLNQLHEEMVRATQAAGSLVNGEQLNEDTNDASREWEQVVKKGRGQVTRAADASQSPIADIFRGNTHSITKVPGTHETAVVEPFFTLPIDIRSDGVSSVGEALHALFGKETVHGVGNSRLDAVRRTSLHTLPQVLILHLKRFVYDGSGIQKLMRKLAFEQELEISKDILSSACRQQSNVSQRKYRLQAVVTHHGEKASGGHYNTDLFHNRDGRWLRCDDGLTKNVRLPEVLRSEDERATPYLLFYVRTETPSEA